jgi:TIR domain
MPKYVTMRRLNSPLQPFWQIVGGHMSDEQIQIFISYARDDDEPAPNIANAKGFVDYLHRQMNHKFKVSGSERPEIWRDIDNIYRGEHFWPKIQKELDKSALLLVILSQNWMASDYCRRELEYFIESIQRRGEAVEESIIVVAKNHVPIDERPWGLQKQEGYCFYRESDRQRLGDIEEFFVRGSPVENHYWPLFDELCTFLIKRSGQLRRVKFTEPQLPTNARTIYVAKTATDMFDEYIRVVSELTNHGYNVVPKRSDEMPRDRSASDFIDKELAQAEASVHLIGESEGWEPEDLDKIVKLQLARAAAKAGGKEAGAAAGSPFRRIIWAPKVFRRAGPGGEQTQERDPHEVLGRFGGELPSDQVIADDPGNFRQCMIRMLDQWKPVDKDIAVGTGVASGSKVFVLHHEKDRPLARSLRKALREKNVEALFPAVDGDEPDRKALDKDSIKRSDAIVLCWGDTSETWTRAQARQFEDWRAYGRSRNWEPRSVVLGPPPGEFKAEFKEDPPPSEIDQIVEVPDVESIPSEVVNKIVPHGQPEAP